MYVPKHFEETDRQVLHSLIRAHPLGTWVTLASTGLLVNHIPFLLSAAGGTHGTLVGHVARANPVWKTFSTTEPSVVIFQGAESYISPSWYASKQEHGKVVPTWNYAVVHAHGMPRAIEDPAWILDLVSRLAEEHENQQPLPWRVGDAPPDYIDRLLGAIVGIEIPVQALAGKWKVSQNRPVQDRRGVIAGLESRDDARAREMAELVSQR
ncbi:MAG: FMN-binding negative transcriptional regulator [Steroidobacteraceae bacterium]